MAGDRWHRHRRDADRHRAAFDRGHRSARHDEEHFPHEDVEKSTVFDLVYKYLAERADRDTKSRRRNCACDKFNKRQARRKDIRGRDVAAIRTNLGRGIFGGERSRADGNALPKRTSRSSSRECVADYAKAVRDEQRRGKFYVREALSYGLQSGLLIPTDRRRNVLRVSRELGTLLGNVREDNEDRSSDAEYSVRER